MINQHRWSPITSRAYTHPSVLVSVFVQSLWTTLGQGDTSGWEGEVYGTHRKNTGGVVGVTTGEVDVFRKVGVVETGLSSSGVDHPVSSKVNHRSES